MAILTADSQETLITTPAIGVFTIAMTLEATGFLRLCERSYSNVSAPASNPHANTATYLNVQPQLPPSQIDLIIVSSRWSSSVRGCKTMWGLSMWAHGRKYDHSVVAMTFKLKQRCQQPSIKRDFKALKSDTTSSRFENKLQEELAKTDRPQDTHAAWARLKLVLQLVKETLPLVKRTGSTSKHETSAATRQLIQQRAHSVTIFSNFIIGAM